MSTERTAATSCDGSSECVSELHIHGCFADKGNCDEPAEHDRSAAQKQEYHPLSVVERRVIALYIAGILLGVAAGFALATMLWGLNEVMP